MMFDLDVPDIEILLDGLECLEVILGRHKDYLLLLEKCNPFFINNEIKHVKEIRKKLTIAKQREEVNI